MIAINKRFTSIIISFITNNIILIIIGILSKLFHEGRLLVIISMMSVKWIHCVHLLSFRVEVLWTFGDVELGWDLLVLFHEGMEFASEGL